jgi:hypothetical protein
LKLLLIIRLLKHRAALICDLLNGAMARMKLAAGIAPVSRFSEFWIARTYAHRLELAQQRCYGRSTGCRLV